MSKGYNLLGVDLRNTSAVESLLFEHAFDLSLPTLFLSECVLCYINPTVRHIVRYWAALTLLRSLRFFSGFPALISCFLSSFVDLMHFIALKILGQQRAYQDDLSFVPTLHVCYLRDDQAQ